MTASPGSETSRPKDRFDVGFDLETLRPPEFIDRQDPRSEMTDFSIENWREFPPLGLTKYHALIAEFVLDNSVPKEIVIQFEVAKNLYLYSWFIYRFYPVAEGHVLACLELALRSRYESEMREKFGHPAAWRATLKPLLKYAIDTGAIRNEDFEAWHHTAEMRARARFEYEKLTEMREKGLDSITYSYSDVVVTDEDRDWNYVGILCDHLPFLRNLYAHGSTSLHNQVLGTFEIVSAIINRVYHSDPDAHS